MNEACFEIVDHTADWSIRVVGVDWAGLLVHAAWGMSSLMVADLTAVSPTLTRTFTLDAFDRESLLVAWLGELAYLAEVEQFVGCKFHLADVTEQQLTAVVHGDHVPELQKHIKAVTYHNLEIQSTPQGLVATLVFDV